MIDRLLRVWGNYDVSVHDGKTRIVSIKRIRALVQWQGLFAKVVDE